MSMNYQSAYPYPQRNYWLDLAIKVGTLLGGAAIAATIGVHMIHKYSPPARTAPIARIVEYFGKGGIGAVGETAHWTSEASEGTREWRKAVRYCQAQAQSGENAKHAPAGCGAIETLVQSGY